MTWAIRFDRKAEKEFAKLPPDAKQLIYDYLKRRLAPQADPRDLGERMKGYALEYWRFRVAKYRLIAEIKDKQLIIQIVRVAKRDAVYKTHL